MALFGFLQKTKNEVPYEKINEELDVFTKASLAMPKFNNPFLLDDQNKQPMIYGYFVGAMNHLAQTYDLNEKDKTDIYKKYLSRNFANNGSEQTAKLLKYSTDISQDENNHNTILVGELAMKKWRAGGPMAEYAPMGLIRLLND